MMAESPKTVQVHVAGELILRLADGSEYVIGTLDSEVPARITYVPSEGTPDD